jgi:hypothetical protein
MPFLLRRRVKSNKREAPPYYPPKVESMTNRIVHFFHHGSFLCEQHLSPQMQQPFFMLKSAKQNLLFEIKHGKMQARSRDPSH